MDNLETAIKFGVATFETSHKLYFLNTTNFYWCKNQKNEMLVLTLKEVNLLCLKFRNENYVDVICKAPQMHEISNTLPEVVYGKNSGSLNYPYYYFCNENFIGYGSKEFLSVEMQKNHFAESYALLYIKIRNASIIKKEAQND